MGSLGNQLVAKDKTLELERGLKTFTAKTFTNALKVFEPAMEDYGKLRINVKIRLTEKEKTSLKQLTQAFERNITLQQLEFENLEVNDEMVANAVNAGVRKDTIVDITFRECLGGSERELLKQSCGGLRERSAEFILHVSNCSGAFAKPLLNASHWKCNSLFMARMDCTGLENPLKKMFRANLCSISLRLLDGFNEKLFLDLSRCISMLPRLEIVDVHNGTLPLPGLKRLLGSVKHIMKSERSGVLKWLHLSKTQMSDELTFAFFKLLESDAFCSLKVNVK